MKWLDRLALVGVWLLTAAGIGYPVEEDLGTRLIVAAFLIASSAMLGARLRR